MSYLSTLSKQLFAACVVLSTLLSGTNTGQAQDLDAKQIRQPAEFTVAANDPALISKGEALFSDTSLSSNGMSCASCHADFGAFSDTFKAPYPHMVQMAEDRAGFEEVTAAEMVQLCMRVPMAADPLDWEGDKIKALTAYVVKLQKDFAQQSE